MPEERLPIKFQSPSTQQQSDPDAAPETAASGQPTQRLQSMADLTTQDIGKANTICQCPMSAFGYDRVGCIANQLGMAARTDVKQPRSKPDRPAHRPTSPTLQPMHANAINGEPIYSQKQSFSGSKASDGSETLSLQARQLKQSMGLFVSQCEHMCLLRHQLNQHSMLRAGSSGRQQSNQLTANALHAPHAGMQPRCGMSISHASFARRHQSCSTSKPAERACLNQHCSCEIHGSGRQSIQQGQLEVH
jgi:hypothetical protein